MNFLDRLAVMPTWGITDAHTLADTYLAPAALTGGGVGEMAACTSRLYHQ